MQTITAGTSRHITSTDNLQIIEIGIVEAHAERQIVQLATADTASVVDPAITIGTVLAVNLDIVADLSIVYKAYIAKALAKATMYNSTISAAIYIAKKAAGLQST